MYYGRIKMDNDDLCLKDFDVIEADLAKEIKVERIRLQKEADVEAKRLTKEEKMSTKCYVKFEIICENPKTNVYSVKNKNSEDLIGFIKWHGVWRQYCFFTVNSIILSKGCMKDINDFIDKIMKERNS